MEACSARALDETPLDRDRDQFMVALGSDCSPGVREDPMDLTGGDIEGFGDLGLLQSLVGKVDHFKLPARQFRHNPIESIGTIKFKSPALGMGLWNGHQGEWIVNQEGK